MHVLFEILNGKSLKFFTKNWLSVVSLAVGILGLAYAYVGDKEKSFSIFMDEEITQIIKSSNIKSSKFNVFDVEGKKIKGDISAFKVKLINDGDLSIWNKDLLIPIDLIFIDKNSHKIKILDYFMDSSSRSNVIRPTVEKIDDRLRVSFKIVEGSDYLSITILFLGSVLPDMQVKGAIEGVSKISLSQKTSSPDILAFLVAILISISCVSYISIITLVVERQSSLIGETFITSIPLIIVIFFLIITSFSISFYHFILN